MVLFAACGLGFFCGPILDLASSWKRHVPVGGFVMMASLTVGIGVALFTALEGMSQSEAVYASVIAGEYEYLEDFVCNLSPCFSDTLFPLWLFIR